MVEVDYTADFGDFASNVEEEADVEDFCEPWHRYDMRDNPHPFYPICLGDVVNGRYLVEHKLGCINLVLVVSPLFGWRMISRAKKIWLSRSCL